MRRKLSTWIGLWALVCLVGVARADNVDVLLADLKTGTDFKIRLSAALSLTKLGDKRAIPGFVAALSDGDKTVRGAAAVGLGKVVSAEVASEQRGDVVKALTALLARETSDSVKKQAENARQLIKGLDGGGAGAVYVDIGQMSANAEPAAKMRTLMKSVAEKTLVTKARGALFTTWPSGKPPSRAELDAKKIAGYHIDGTLTELAVKGAGASAYVSCKISMLLATFPEKSVFGFLDGGASVTAANDPADIGLAQEDCVNAVVADLVSTKIVPTIKLKAGL